MVDGSLKGLLRRTIRWAWERDEVGQPSTKQTVKYTAIMYGLAVALAILSGVALAVTGYPTVATALLTFGIWILVIFGTINVGWEWIAYRLSRRAGDRPEREHQGPTRELAPDIRIADETKVGFVVTVAALVALVVSYELALAVVSAVV